MKQIQVSKNEAGQRLDKLLAKYLNKAPKSFIYKMLRKKNITLNGKKAAGNEMLTLNDEIKMFLADETIENFSELKVDRIKPNLKILYEDTNIMIINKPAGILSQKAETSDVSMVEHMISYLLDKGEITMDSLQSFKPSVCNRLDRNTSGIIVAGKSLAGLQTMSEIFKERSLHKYYRCIVNGRLEGRQLIDGYLVKDEKTNKVRILKEETPDSKYIRTEYEPLFSDERITYLEVKLITGRSHQIRAHLASIGHPIIGDIKYGNRTINEEFRKKCGISRQLLHSYRLEMPQIKGPLKYLSGRIFEAEVPQDFKKVLKGF